MSGLDRFVTRRDLLCRGGMGIGALALSGVMQDAFGSDAPSALNIESPLTPRATSLCRDGQTGHSPVPQRRAVARRHI